MSPPEQTAKQKQARTNPPTRQSDGWRAEATEILWAEPKLTSFRIIKENLRDPVGREHVFTYIDQPKQGVSIVALSQDHGVYLVRQYRPIVGRTLLEVPGGGVEPGQSPLEAAHQELLEETGLRADSMTLIGQFFPAVGLSNSHGLVYLARDVTIGPREPTMEPVGDVVEFPLDGVDALLDSGEILHGTTVIALAMVRRFLAAERLN
jgi:ADP-ribose pyrophosphatase